MAAKSDLPSSVPDTPSRDGSTGSEETDADGPRNNPGNNPRNGERNGPENDQWDDRGEDERGEAGDRTTRGDRADNERTLEINSVTGANPQRDWQPPFDLSPAAASVSIVPGHTEDPERRRRKREVREKQEQAEKYLRAIGHVKPAHASVFEIAWQDLLLDCLLKMAPSAFERLCQKILRESGFIKVDVTGRSGDGGIDGIGVLRLNLLSFHVFFQCKRWKGSVGASAIRDFRGAMVGRADKGLVMTTGTFTADARKEATRDGAPAIDLVDGEALCDLLKSLRIGVSTQKVEHVFIEQDAFLQF
jgi:Restriction endonuclease